MNANDIQAAYESLGYSLGWRFLTCPEHYISNARMLLVTLNPGGNKMDGPSWSQEAGSAYFVESWGGQAPGQDSLQRQVQLMLQSLNYRPDEVLSAHFVPFRSPRWADLQNKRAAQSFATKLWVWLLSNVKPEAVVCVGHKVGEIIAPLVGARDVRSMPTGWGNISLQSGKLPNGGPFVSLPHLGTFKLFSSPPCEPYLKAAFR